MAGKDKVYIDIIVDDKGTTKRVAVDSKKLGVALDDVEKSQKRTGKSAKDADRNLKGLSKQSSNTTKNFSKMAQGMTGTLVPAYAVLASNVFAITAAFQFLKKAADFRVMQESQVAFTGATGVGMQSLTANIQSASEAMLDFQSASEAASIGIASGLSSGQITDLAEGAGNLSKILGRDVTDSFNRLVRGVTKAEPELLDELGITLRLADANENYAATLNKSAKDLTTFEKKQAVFVEVQTQLEKKYNAVAKATNVQGNSITKLGVAFDRVMKKVKEWTAVIAEPVAEFFTKNILSLTAALALLAVPIIRSIIPGLDEWGKKSEEAAEKASKSYKKAQEELDELSQQQKDIASGKSTTAGIQDPSKGLQRTGGDISKLNKQEAAALLRHAHNKNKKLAHMDKKQLSTYRIHLKAKVRGSYTAFEKIVLYYNQMGQKMDVQNKKMVSRWKAAMAMMQGAAAKFTWGMDKLMKGLGIVGIALMVKDIGKELLMYMGFFSEVKGIQDLMESFRVNVDTMKSLNKEYKDFTAIQKALRKLEADDPKMLEDTLGTIKAEGQFFSTMGKGILDTNNALRDQKKLLDELIQPARELNQQEQHRLKVLEANVKAEKFQGARGGGSMQGAAWKGLTGWGQEESRKQVQALKGLETASAAAAAKEMKRLQDLSAKRAASVAEHEKGMSTIAETVGDLSERQQKAVKITIGYLESLSGSKMSVAQQRYLELLKIIESGKQLDTDDAKEFSDLNDQLGLLGSKAQHSAEEFTALETQFKASISSITTYKTSYTDLIASMEQARETIKQIADAEGGYSEQLKKNDKQYQNQLNSLKALRDLEVDLANNKLILQTAFTAAKRGATPLQIEELARAEEITNNNLKILDIQNRINVAKEHLGGMDIVTENNLENQITLLEEQNRTLEAQGDIRAILIEDMKTGFETGLQKGISDVLKGDASIKEALAGMAKGIVDTMIDSVAKSLTQDIMNAMGMQTEEQRAAEAMRVKVEEGIKNGTLVLDEKLKTSAAPAMATEVKESVVAAGEAVKTAMTEGATELTIALDETITRLADAIREACASCVCTPGAGGAPTGTGTAAAGMDQLEEITVSAKRREDPFAPVEWDPEGQGERPSWAGGVEDSGGGAFASVGAGGEGKEGGGAIGQLNKTMKESNKITMKEVAGLGMAVTALLGNSKAGKALQKILAVFYLFEMGKTVWEKGKFLWDKLFGAKDLVSESANTSAVIALTAATLKAAATNLIGAKGIYPPPGYATGGIARGPRSGYPAILHGNEAVVPLPNGKDIPVTFPRGGGPGGMQNNNVGVTINMDSEGGSETITDADSQEAQELGERVAFAVQQELLNQKRSGGMLSPYGVA